MNDKLTDKVVKNKHGYYELKDIYRKPMKDFYEEEYYHGCSLYLKEDYDKADLEYRKNLFMQKIAVLKEWKGKDLASPKSFLDIGCGEGYALAFFDKEGWDVCGIDLSSYGLKIHNPEMLRYLQHGDFYEVAENLLKEKKTFDFINADNVLEHLPDPEKFIHSLTGLSTEETVICITVPNDFSIMQELAYDLQQIDSSFWVTDKTSEHFNYFSVQSLVSLFESAGFEKISAIADWPIDFFLLHPASNYQKNGDVGHDCHVACVTLENEIFNKSMKKTVKLHQALAELGLGREISVFFSKKMPMSVKNTHS